MSQLRKFIWVGLAMLSLPALLVGSAAAGDFAGSKLYLDTKIDTGTAVNDSLASVRLPSAGDVISFELWLPGASGKGTFGFNLIFDNTSGVFADNWTAEVKDFRGSAMAESGTSPGEFSALIVPSATMSSDLLATVTLTAKQDIVEGVTVKVDSTSSMADAAAAQDLIAVTNAVLTFVAGPKIAADAMYDITKPIPLPINASAAVTVNATGFGAGMTITWTVTPDMVGTASVAGVASADGLSNTITATGPGSATVTVSASDGTDTTNELTITFSQQEAAELATFGGELVDDRVVVSWSTASQTNNAGWRLLRSVDGENFEAVSEMVQGAGTSDAMLSYSIEDVNLPSNEKVWYQLEQVDLDGSISRSNPVEVLLGARMPVPTVFSTNVYPNPFNPSTTISYDLPNESFVSIVIYDAIGQEIRRLVSEQTAAGRYRVQWDALDTQGRAVGSGVYIAKVEAGSFSSSQKMLLLK